MPDEQDTSATSPPTALVERQRARKAKRAPISDAERARRASRKVSAAKYQRGKSGSEKGMQDKKARAQMRHTRAQIKSAVARAAQAEMLLPTEAGGLEAEGEMERTYKVRQDEIRGAVDVQSANKAFELTLPEMAPYVCAYSRNGRSLLLGGRKGHLALMDWQKCRANGEVQVRETVRDVTFLHTEQMYAVAQRRAVYIYDDTGMELHVLRKHIEPNVLDFLPYHFLLVSVGKAGWLKYQDVSTGELVVEHRTKLGECRVMRQNPWNAVMCLGHHSGQVSMWTPNVSEAVVKIMCHRGPVHALAVDRSGQYMATAGADGQVKVFDVRTYKPVHAYFAPTPATHLDISQRGMLAIASNSRVQVWRDALRTKAKSPYMVHTIPGARVSRVRFCPYEDVLGVGHARGFSSLLIPGSGEPNFDTYEANPYQTRRQRREHEVHALLDKLRPDMITLDPTQIGNLDRAHKEVQQEEKRKAVEAAKALRGPKRQRNKMRGKNKASKRYRKKQDNVVAEKKGQWEADQRERSAEMAKAKAAHAEEVAAHPYGKTLGRFM